MGYSRYKDAAPNDTIGNIKKIFNELGINLECKIKQKIEGVFSATLTDRTNGWNACGKGATSEFCMASAYGEAIEHLSSYYAYNIDDLVVASETIEFLRYPDEQIKPINDIPLRNADVFRDMQQAFCRLGRSLPDTKSIIKVWEDFLESTNTTFVPYYSVKNKDVVMLPDIVVDKICGSNGGGAGNTPAEAIGHGLDEICERYAKYLIYKEQLTPPSIPREYIEVVCPELYATILDIEHSGPLKVIVKDASLGKGFPVVAVLLVDTSQQTYLANFGCHPRFEIALERCLTEMFQLYSIGENTLMNHKQMEQWASDVSNIDFNIRNWVSLLRDDTGIIPDSFFAGAPSWKFEPWYVFQDYSNEIGVIYQINQLLNFGVEDIYIRNVSFLGFPVYRIYIPSVSTSFIALDDELLHSYQIGKEMVDFIKKPETLHIDYDILMTYKDTLFADDSFVCDLIFRNMNRELVNSFRAAIFCDLGNREVALNILKDQNNRMCQCALRELELQRKGIAVEIRNELLCLFFGEEEMVYASCWRDNNIFETLIRRYVLNNKTNLNGNSSKKLDLTRELHIKIHEKMKKNTQDQHQIGYHLDLYSEQYNALGLSNEYNTIGDEYHKKQLKIQCV